MSQPPDDHPGSTDPADEGCYRLLEVTQDSRGLVVERFATLEYALSAWGTHLQHGGPVAGLLVRAMQRCQPQPGMRISRVVVEILGAVPPCDVQVRSWVERPGRRIELVAAELAAAGQDGSWRPVARSWGWRLATQPTDGVAHRADRAVPPAADSAGLGPSAFPPEWRIGFVTALDWQFVTPMGQHGVPSTAWVRMVQPLVVGEEPTGLEQAAAIADVANGVGARLDTRSWTFLNTDLTIHLFEEPVGPWFGVEAETSIGHDGVGMSAATLHGPSGPIGRIAQALLVKRRPAGAG